MDDSGNWYIQHAAANQRPQDSGNQRPQTPNTNKKALLWLDKEVQNLTNRAQNALKAPSLRDSTKAIYPGSDAAIIWGLYRNIDDFAKAVKSWLRNQMG